MKKRIAVRLEGGVGDHILGMRLVGHVRSRYPDHSIHIYSDCGGFRSQLQVCTLSPHVDHVVPVYQDRNIVNASNAGSLDNLLPGYIEQMKVADVFFDTWPGPVYKKECEDIDCGTMFIPHAEMLGVSNLTILASRPELVIPDKELHLAKALLRDLGNYRFIALNLEKYGSPYVEACLDFLQNEMLRFLEEAPEICILNVYSTDIQFPHYPDGYDSNRRRLSVEAASSLARLNKLHPRIVPIRDMPIIPLAALLAQCDYLLGVDNGIKHVAWALGVPLKFFTVTRPSRDVLLRWMPDPNNLCVISEQQRESRFIFDGIRDVLQRCVPSTAREPKRLLQSL